MGNEAEPNAPVQGNAHDRKFAKRLNSPSSLWDAAQRLRASNSTRFLFADAFVNHFAFRREWEEREYSKHISNWEMQRYSAIIKGRIVH